MRWVAAVAVLLIVSANAWGQDWGARRDPFDAAVVSRYKAILARNPHDVGALRELVGLYQRYRSLAKLEAEYRAQVETREDWASLVVLARLPRTGSGEVIAESVSWWKRAVAAKPDDARGWLALGDAIAADAAGARDAYRHAAQHAGDARTKRIALTKLIGAARDPKLVDDAYADLIALAPKDGRLWLERGNAQLAAKQLAAAKDSFATAEQLLRTDPERRLTAMVNQGIALDGLGRPDDAIAQYERALAKVPTGYFLREEIVTRIVDIERKRKRLGAAIERFAKRWPERTRGYFEWVLLGDIYKETGDEERAIDAYRRAVGKAPTEVVTQRKLIALLDKLHPDDALAQHEAAARVAPGDADLQLALAKRYRAAEQPEKALATLAALARRSSKNINVRSAIAALYEEWNEPKRAIGEYEAIVAAEPREPDHALVLGDAYWRANQQEKARGAWQRLEKIGTAEALYRYGEVLAMHDWWTDAAAAYTKSLALDGTNVNAFYGRARAFEALHRMPDAAADARRAVALDGAATYVDGMRDRQLLVRVLGGAGDDDHAALADAVARWRFAFDRGEVTAGYLLAAHHGRIASHQLHDVLVELYRRVPADDSLGVALARSYVHRRQFGRAKQELERIAQRTPARAEDMRRLIAQVDEDRERAERDIRMQEERGSLLRYGSPDLVGRRRRFGMRFEVGGDVRNTSTALVGLGWYYARRLATGTALAFRFDWMQRDDDMVEHAALSLGAGVATRILDTRKLELAAGAGARVELRYGDSVPSAEWNRAALGGDITLELLPRALPATLGLRFHHTLTDPSRSSALLLELGFEVR